MYVYYTLVSIQEDLHCASQKALKLLKELESNSVGGRNGDKGLFSIEGLRTLFYI